jgi:hypothetical protein
VLASRLFLAPKKKQHKIAVRCYLSVGAASMKMIQDFILSFNSIHEFAMTFDLQRDDTGAFISMNGSSAAVGQDARIKVVIDGFLLPFYLTGFVAWRRLRSGPQLPSGVYIKLNERERSRLGGIINHFKTSKQLAERRKSPRFPLIAGGVYETAKGNFVSETRDISKGGVFIECDGPLISVGARFPVVLYLDGQTAKGIQLHAQVAWIELFDESKGMGLIFERGQSGIKQVYRALKRIDKQMKK